MSYWTSLRNMDCDQIENMIDAALSEHIRVFETYDYFIVDDNTVIVKIFNEYHVLVFTVTMTLAGNQLRISSEL